MPPPQIVKVVTPERERLDACMVFPSMPAVMKLNKLGTFSMGQLGQSKSAIADFMRSSMKKARETNENYEEGLLKLVRTLPTVRMIFSSGSWLWRFGGSGQGGSSRKRPVVCTNRVPTVICNAAAAARLCLLTSVKTSSSAGRILLLPSFVDTRTDMVRP